MIKKYRIVIIGLVISAGFFVMGTLESCENPSENPQEEVIVIKDNLHQEFLGTIGKGTRGSFSLFKFTVDSTTYLVGSEYGGGMCLIDKVKK